MRIINLSLFCLMIFLVQCSFAKVTVGSIAQDFTLPYLDGIFNFNLSQNLSVRNIIYFWSPISETQREQMILLKHFYDEYYKKGVQVIAILSFSELEDKSNAIKFIKENSISFINLIDNQNITKIYGVTSTPALFVLDETRKVIECGSDITDKLLGQIEKELEDIKHVKKEPSKIRKESPILPNKPEKKLTKPSSVAYGLAGAGLNALLPGLGGSVYEKRWFNFSTSGFYLMGLFTLIDYLGKPKNFLTENDEKNYENIIKMELFITAGFYVLNIINGYQAGSNYARREKR